MARWNAYSDVEDAPHRIGRDTEGVSTGRAEDRRECSHVIAALGGESSNLENCSPDRLAHPTRELFMLLEIGNMSLLYIPGHRPSNTPGNVILHIRSAPVAIPSL